MDCLQGLPLIKNKSVDLVITDPPFAINFTPRRPNYNRKSSRVLEGYKEIAPNEYLDFSIKWMREGFRVLKETGSIFVFSGWNYLKDILTAADETGFTIVNHIIWKYQFGVVCKKKFVTSHYHCLFMCKNDAKRKFFNSSRFKKEEKSKNGGSLRYQDMEDVWVINREYWHGDKKTPTKLPAALIEKILHYTTEPGDLILDPFLGSGQVAVISKLNDRRYIGFEIVKEYYEFARERLEKGIYRISDSEKN
jgi:site-specific DNA-methyltransferase (adenine-specific)